MCRNVLEIDGNSGKITIVNKIEDREEDEDDDDEDEDEEDEHMSDDAPKQVSTVERDLAELRARTRSANPIESPCCVMLADHAIESRNWCRCFLAHPTK